jgi:hypothetical protein
MKGQAYSVFSFKCRGTKISCKNKRKFGKSMIPVTFSKEEFELLNNKEVFQTKKKVVEKLTQAFGSLNHSLEKLLPEFEDVLPPEVVSSKGKISRGENYLGYPWMILDYPRVFKHEDVFAFRSLCWWGNHFSFTVHLGGKYLTQWNDKISLVMDDLKGKSIYICIADSPWHHHFEKENYILTDELISKNHSGTDHICGKNFLKLSIMLPLNEISFIEQKAVDFFKTLLTAIAKHCR